MSVNAVVGYPGSGKSYEVVLNHVLPAIAAGRRVVTNVSGIRHDAILEYLEAKGTDIANAGTILEITSEDVLKEDTFPTLDNKDGATVHGGDLVVIDEAWRYFGNWLTVPKRLQGFLAEHRHFVDTNGVSCDITWMAQTETMICLQVRRLTEFTVKVNKLKALGASNSYSANSYIGPLLRSNPPSRTQVCRYDKKVFALYSSYEGKGGNEAEVDKRINFLRSPMVTIGLPLGIVLVALSWWYLYRYFTGDVHKKKTDTVVLEIEDDEKSSPVDKTAGRKTGSKATSTVGGTGLNLEVEDSDWRVVGWIDRGAERIVYLERDGQKRTLFNPPFFNYAHRRAEGMLDGKRLSEWTGKSGGDNKEDPLRNRPGINLATSTNNQR